MKKRKCVVEVVYDTNIKCAFPPTSCLTGNRLKATVVVLRCTFLIKATAECHNGGFVVMNIVLTTIAPGLSGLTFKLTVWPPVSDSRKRRVKKKDMILFQESLLLHLIKEHHKDRVVRSMPQARQSRHLSNELESEVCPMKREIK